MTVTGEPILGITPRGVEHGDLLRSFEKGGAAVILSGECRIQRLLQSIVKWLGFDDPSSRESFGSNLIDLARNHLKENPTAGDMLRIQPGVFGHIARKFLIFPRTVDQSLASFPDAFYSNNRRVPVPYSILESAWNLMSEVLISALPRHANALAYAVEVDVLIYPISSLSINRLHVLLSDSCGAWSRVGHRIDANKGNAAGMFDKKVIRDLFAILSLIPGPRELVTMLNNRMRVASDGCLPSDYFVVGGPHIDEGKYITGLIGCRHNLHTQIFSGKRWVPLPVTSDTMTILPGLKISSLNNISPTRHRVVLQNPLKSEGAAAQNITLSLSIVAPPAICSRPASFPEDTIER
jgi:hypothetical protein